jgi:hypothetical protein
LLHDLVYADAPLRSQPGEDHRLVRAGAERLPDGEQKHRTEQRYQLSRQPEHDEAGDVGNKREDHRLAAAVHVGHRPGRDLERDHRQLAEGDQQADVEKAETFLQERQDEKRLEIPLVLEKPVEAETCEHEGALL